MKLRKIGILLLLYSSSLFCVPRNRATKLLHHKVQKADSSLEMGSVVLYLDQKPNITGSKKADGDKMQMTYLLHDVGMQPELQNTADRINQDNGLPYTVSIQKVQKPKDGLQLTFTYNPREVGLSYELFDTITLKKGVVFRIFNKKVLSKIQASAKPIIQVAANIPMVVIDCGHGGIDNGAVGCCGIKEKEVNLQVGMQVAQLLKDQKIDVLLVRNADQTHLLDERTTFANKHDANLFVSIHANAAPNASLSGIETYCLGQSLFSRGDTTLAKPEYAAVAKRMHEKYAKSRALAQIIHQSLLGAVQSDYNVNDRHIKQSVAQVLLGTTMPSVLIELGFLTHQNESALLTQKQYQSRLARGIAGGILSYLGRI